MKQTWKTIQKFWKSVCLVDKFLIAFMAILFSYTTINLFFHAFVSESSNTIDIIIRTSSAAIFGYFLSGNFVKTKTNPKEPNTLTPAMESKTNTSRCNKTQVVVVSMIGIFSLILLGIVRTFFSITPEITATVSQLRDFVSAGVGFLVGCGKEKESE